MRNCYCSSAIGGVHCLDLLVGSQLRCETYIVACVHIGYILQSAVVCEGQYWRGYRVGVRIIVAMSCAVGEIVDVCYCASTVRCGGWVAGAQYARQFLSTSVGNCRQRRCYCQCRTINRRASCSWIDGEIGYIHVDRLIKRAELAACISDGIFSRNHYRAGAAMGFARGNCQACIRCAVV